MDLNGSGTDPMVSSCKHRNEPLGSIKGGKFSV